MSKPLMSSSFGGLPFSLIGRLRAAALGLCVAIVAIVAGCGGGADAPPPVEGAPGAVAPVITQQPASLTVTAGQPASFTVAATGTAPLAYQWQRNGSDITGATAAAYTLSTTAIGDSGAVFRAVVSNSAGSAASNDAILTVSVAAPVLTITPQPADTSVVAGTAASFTVGGTCSSGTLQIQWQRLSGSAFADIAGATTATYTLTPAIGDNGAQFRANLSCSGQSTAASSVATLTVTAPPSGGILSQFVLTGLRNQADIGLLGSIVREASGSFAFTSGRTVRRLSADLSAIALIAGSSTDTSPSVDGVGSAARFSTPRGITVDAAGNLYIVDVSDNTVRRIAADGTVTTIAGQAGASGTADGSGSAARFSFPNAIAAGPDGDLYVSDGANSAIRRVTTAGVVTTYAGSTGNAGLVDGTAAAARFQIPQGVAVATDGTVYVSDAGNSRIRRIARNGNAAGNVDTFAGGASASTPIDATGTAAGIVAPRDLTISGNTLLVRDASRLVRAIDLSTRAVTTFTGNSAALPLGVTVGFADGPRGTGTIDGSVGGVAAIGDGRLVLSDGESGSLRLVATDGYIKTIATSSAYDPGYFDHTGVGVLLQQPIVFNNTRPALAAAPDGSIVVATIPALRRIAPDGSVTPIAGLTGAAGRMVGGSNSEVSFIGLSAAAVKADGTIAVFDGTAVRTVAPGTNTVSTLAGSTTGAQASVDGTGTAARFQSSTSIVYAANGDILVADAGSGAIRRVTPAGVVTTFAGTLGQFGNVDGAPGTARFQNPGSIALAPDGTLWVADKGNSVSKLRQVAADGTVSTVAVSGVDLSFGTLRLAFDPAGNLFLLAGGLYQINPATGAATLLIPVSQSGTTFGNSPTVAAATDRLVAVGVKQLVFEDVDSGMLLRATLP